MHENIHASIMVANQRRRRIESSPDSCDTKESASSIFHALNTQIDCTRFVQIDPAKSDDAQIVCKLVHVAFGNRPKFEALSYMWGDVNQKGTVILNGLPYSIGKNLWDALRYLRRLNQHEPDKLFWVDALSINQEDVAERTRQVQLMGQIYFRASKVIVWLGDKYSHYQSVLDPKILREQPISLRTTKKSKKKKAWGAESSVWATATTPSNELPEPWNPTSTGPFSPLESRLSTEPSIRGEVTTDESPWVQITDMDPESVKLAMGERLVKDDYWRRLWIIQEIGQAREIDVCFGTWASPWEEFIPFLSNFVVSGRPLSLDSQLRKDANQSHTLKELLENHQDALCKDKRDKVYGLVGLAVDATRFPIDYSHSLFEVWSDTMEYMRTHGLLEGTDVIKFGQLVKTLLMGSGSEPLLKTLWPPRSLLGPGDVSFTIPGYVLGRILTVGPSTAELLCKLDTVAEWNSALHTNYQKHVGVAHKESKTLLRAVLESRDEALADLALDHACGIIWDIRQDDNPLRFANFLVESQEDELAARDSSGHSPHLYQLRLRDDAVVSSRLGLAPSSAKVGDAICWVCHTKRALIIRWTSTSDGGLDRMGMIGTAMISEDVVGTDVDHEKRVDRYIAGSQLEHPFGQPMLSSSPLKILIDAQTLYVLLS